MILRVLSLVVAVWGFGVRAEADDERWMVVLLDGKKIGSAVERRAVGAEGNLTTSVEMRLEIGRMGEPVRIVMGTEFIEAKDHTPLRMSSTQEMGASRVVERYSFNRGVAGDEVIRTTESQGRSTAERRDWPGGEWLTPGAARARVAELLGSGSREFSVMSIDPSIGLEPVVASYRVLGREDIEVLGKIVPSVRWSVSLSAMPGVESTEHVDPRGNPLRSVIELGGLTLTLLSADKEVALSEFEVPELMAKTLISPTGNVIERPRGVRGGTFVLSIAGDDGAAFGDRREVPEVGAQRVTRVEGGMVRVIVEAGRSSSAREDVGERAYREASTMIDSRDPEIAAFVEAALGGVAAPARRKAEVLRRAVSRHVEAVDLGVGFATASEVVRTRRGDCSEFGVLLAAGLRAAGIPARVVTGLVYVERMGDQRGVFGYHVWTQAMIEDEAGGPVWIDLDAAIPAEEVGGFDATHIALGTGSFSAEDTGVSLVGIVGLFGKLRIEVEDVRH